MGSCPASQEYVQISVTDICNRIQCHKGEAIGNDGPKNKHWHFLNNGVHIVLREKQGKEEKDRSLGETETRALGDSLTKHCSVSNKAESIKHGMACQGL